MNRTVNLDLSPDGRHMYVVSQFSSTVLIFERNQQTGLLGQSALPRAPVHLPDPAGLQAGVEGSH